MLGTDVPLLNGWVAASTDADGEPPARLYKQGGRVWMSGYLKAPGGNAVPFNIPETHYPELFGESWDVAAFVTIDWSAVRAVEFAGGSPPDYASGDPIPFVLTGTAPEAGLFVGFDGISWPAAS